MESTYSNYNENDVNFCLPENMMNIQYQPEGYYTFSYALYPGTYQPSGSVRFSRAREFYNKISACNVCHKSFKTYKIKQNKTHTANEFYFNIEPNELIIEPMCPDCDCRKIIRNIIIKSFGPFVPDIILEYCNLYQ